MGTNNGKNAKNANAKNVKFFKKKYILYEFKY